MEDVDERLFWLRLGGMDVVPVDDGIGLRAGRLHARRERRPVAPADCAAPATSLSKGDQLATSDRYRIEAARTRVGRLSPFLRARETVVGLRDRRRGASGVRSAQRR